MLGVPLHMSDMWDAARMKTNRAMGQGLHVGWSTANAKYVGCSQDEGEQGEYLGVCKLAVP
jgi:hypothetical protein